MSKNKWVRSISFNKANPKDVERLNLIGRKSFSRYIKYLLDQEIKRQKANTANNEQIAIPQAATNTAKPQQPQQVTITVNTKPVTPQPTPKVYTNPMLKGR